MNKKSSLLKIAIIRKENNKFVVYSESGRKFGEYSSEKDAKKRIRQMEMFKHMKKNGMLITPETAKKLKSLVDNSLAKQLKRAPHSEGGILESLKSSVSKVLAPAAAQKPLLTKNKAKKILKTLKNEAKDLGRFLK